MKLISIDFEFRGSNETKLDLVAACIKINQDKPIVAWLHNDDTKKKKLRDLLMDHKDHTLLSYFCSAESRGLISLGIHPLKFQWLDMWVAYKLLLNQPHDSNKMTGLIQCCQDMGVIYQHAEQKEEIRELILTAKTFSDRDKKKIMAYCIDDTVSLPKILEIIIPRLQSVYDKDPQWFINKLKYFSYYCATLGVCEALGTPIDIERMNNLISNYRTCKAWLVEQIDYPFYTWDSKKEDYTLRYAVVEDFIIANGYSKFWEKTNTGKFKTDEKTLAKYDHIHLALKNFHQYHKILSCVKYFNPKRLVFPATIGSDGHSRALLGPYGTVSGRNAPKASQFIPAMTSLFRSLIRPEPGMAITSIDWSAQEFALGALLSNDEVMMDAYNTGDPYMAFAIRANAVPPEATKGVNKEWDAQRNLFKSTVLGLQYGMGEAKLQIKLTQDTCREITLLEASRLKRLHQITFKKYWEFMASLKQKAYKRKPFFNIEGWGCQSSPEYITSLQNFPVQSSGAALMRKAIILACQRGLRVLFPLHDAIYLYHKEDDLEAPKLLEQCMDEAVSIYFPGAYIRHETETHTHDHLWIEGRSKKAYEQLSKFFDTREPNVDIRQTFTPEIISESLFEGV